MKERILLPLGLNHWGTVLPTWPALPWTTLLDRIKWEITPPLPPNQWWTRGLTKARHFFHHWNGRRGDLNISFILSKIVATLQRVQNNATRLIVGACRFDHMTPTLRDLHRLPIPARLELQILLLTYKCLHNQGSSNLRELLKFRNPSYTLRSSLKSSLQNSYHSNTLYYGERALPSLLLNCGTLYLKILSQLRPCQLLKRRLKLNFFAAASSKNNDTLIV